MKKMTQTTIAIDGPASSGKSTVAKIVAQKLNLIYIDTGAMYRTIAFEALKHHIPLADEKKITDLSKQTRITFNTNEGTQTVFSNGVDVTENIRSQQVTNSVSQVAAYPEVRKELVDQQREMATNTGVVMDGRDIGTVVLPNADVKLFLVATVEARARRRHKENCQKGIMTSLEVLTEEIEQRDYKDSHRESSPLVQAKDAIRLDTTSLSIEEVVATILKIVEEKHI